MRLSAVQFGQIYAFGFQNTQRGHQAHQTTVHDAFGPATQVAEDGSVTLPKSPALDALQARLAALFTDGFRFVANPTTPDGQAPLVLLTNEGSSRHAANHGRSGNPSATLYDAYLQKATPRLFRWQDQTLHEDSPAPTPTTTAPSAEAGAPPPEEPPVMTAADFDGLVIAGNDETPNASPDSTDSANPANDA
ncbi:MAG: hypothetical protein KC474_05660 [Cyanobacteria bacterium HKST-UBA04]|nr:hypothetical protein [Cyanobacteria bacterium HKST-UBA04]